MIYDLPKTVELNGEEVPVRSDYRAILDICIALSDPELNKEEKAIVALDIFYPCFADIPRECYQEAVERCFWFINCGEGETGQKRPKLVDWSKDFPYIVAPINRVMGKEVRDIDYLHWWSFISAYYEIGDCVFAQIVRIRDQKARGKPLDKTDREWYRKNRHLVDIKTAFSQAEDDIINVWTGVKKE